MDNDDSNGGFAEHTKKMKAVSYEPLGSGGVSLMGQSNGQPFRQGQVFAGPVCFDIRASRQWRRRQRPANGIKRTYQAPTRLPP